MSGTTHIGTSGWHYDHWKGPFYPEDTPSSSFLALYAEQFRTAEINNSFYKLPSRETVQSWRETAGDAFTFAFKASRYLTHMKKLKDPAEPLDKVYESADALGDALGPILFQLPPRWKFNADRLENFLEHLSTDYRHAFEFRDESWFNAEAYGLLRQHGAAFCIYELAGRQSPRETTAEFVYIRLHGPGDKYQGRYDRRTLGGWAGAISAWIRSVGDVYCYFDNDEAGYAAINARELQDMMAG